VPARAEPYSLVFSGETARLAPLVPPGAVKIQLLTGSSGDFLAARERERIDAMLARRPGIYVPKRSSANLEAPHADIKASDHCLLIGNAQTLSTYPERLRPRITPIRVSASPTSYARSPGDVVPREREFVWYFGHGAALKGLDLLLEIFARQETWTLNVIGLILDEPDFLRLYGKELFRHPRIRFHGHLRGNAPELEAVMRRSIAFIAPSASEGMSNACATCLSVGLYPILSRQTGIDLPDGLGIYLQDCSLPEIEAAIGRVHAMDDAALAADMIRIQAYAREAFGRPAYARAMRRLLAEFSASAR
jgi:glycosyltransferase involved in cell wall biosynthesis